MWLKDIHKCLVLWVRKVGSPGSIIDKGNNKAVGEVLIKPFRAVVGSPLYRDNTLDGFLELGKLFLDLFNLNIGSIFFELEANNMAI